VERGGPISKVPAQKTRVTAAGKTDPGRVREQNEDYIALAPDLDLFLVADGMGGHASGNIASTLAAKSLRNFFEATRDQPLDEPRHPDDGEAPIEARRLASAIRKANRDVHEISTSHERHKGMGSTVVAIHVADAVAHIAHVGDSRCYRLRDGELQQITRDHSLHNEALALRPNLSAARLAKLPKNVVTRALGMKDQVKVELRHEPIQQGDLFLLCSDGLTGMVKDADILEILAIGDDLQESCDLLVTMANDGGGTDNISVVLVRIDEVHASPPEATVSTSTEVAEVLASTGVTGDEDIDEAELAALLGDEYLPGSHFDRPSSVPPPPSSGPIEPTREITLLDQEKQELLDIEEALAATELAAAERRWSAPEDHPRCRRCQSPLVSDFAYCVECGQEV